MLFGNIDKEKIIQAAIANQAKLAEETKEGLGEPTEFKCHCGGTMHRFDSSARMYNQIKKEAGKPRYSKKKRQAKKNHKIWAAKHKSKLLLAATLARPLRNPMGFACGKCGAREGFYGMMAKSMFRVEPMPEGAKAIYERELPNVLDEESNK